MDGGDVSLLTVARRRTSGGGPPPTGGVASDSFAGDGPLNGRAASDGEHTWTSSEVWETSGGSVRLDASTGTNQIALIGHMNHEYARISSTMVHNYVADTDRAHPSIVFRYKDASNFCFVELHSDVLLVRQVVAGVATTIGFPAHGGVASGVPVVVTADVYVDAVVFEVNGVPCANGEPFAFIAPHDFAQHTGVGIRYWYDGWGATTWARWDDFAVAETTRPVLNWPRFWATGARTFPDLTTGTAGAWDSTDINNPNVIPNPSGGWLMSYSGHYNDGVVPGTQVQELGIATAASLDGPWTKDPDNPSFSETSPQAWNINGGIAYVGGTFVQVYGTDTLAKQIGVATTTDLDTWTVKPRIGEGHDSTMRVRDDGTTLEAYFKRDDGGIWRAVSTDVGETWTVDSAPVLQAPAWMNPGTPNFAEPGIYVPPGKEGEQMILTFDRDSGGRSTYMAVTVDGGVSWQYMIANRGSGAGGGDNNRFDSFMVAHAGAFYLYYAGSDTPTPTLNGNIQIGHLKISWNPATLVR